MPRQAYLPDPWHRYGSEVGASNSTCTCTCQTHTQVPAWVSEPMLCTRYKSSHAWYRQEWKIRRVEVVEGGAGAKSSCSGRREPGHGSRSCGGDNASCTLCGEILTLMTGVRSRMTWDPLSIA